MARLSPSVLSSSVFVSYALFCFVVLLERESTFCMCGILKMVRGVLEAGKGKNGAARLMSS